MKSPLSVACSSLLMVAVAAAGASAAAPRPAKAFKGAKHAPGRYVFQTGTSKDRPTHTGRAPQGGVLYDQTANLGANSSVSQDFETANDPFDAMAADDFVIPAATNWSITGATFIGVYFNGPGPMVNVNVTFSADAAGVPGAAVCTYANIVPTSDTLGTIVVDLSGTPCNLGPGTYWVSAQARMDFTPFGEWGWTGVTTPIPTTAKWQNPGGGFGACPTWGDIGVCIPGADPSLGFQLTGTIVGGGGPTPCQAGANYVAATSGGAIVPGVTDIGNNCDDCATAITLPFPVASYDQVFTNANVISNGSLQFVSADTGFTNVCPMPVAAFDSAIMLWDDMRTDLGLPGCAGYPGGACGVFTSTTGSSPNQVFHIEWRAVYFAATAVPVNFEINLHEDNANFEVVTGALNTQSSATVGVQRDTGSLFTEFACNVAVPDNTQIGYTCTLTPVELMSFSVK